MEVGLAIIGCTTVGYLEHPLDRALDGIAAAGLRDLELGAIPGYCEHAMPGGDAAALREALAVRNLTAHSISAHSALATDAGSAHVLACIEYAAELGLPFVNTGTGPMEGEAEEPFLANAAELAAAAERLDVTIALETQDTQMTSGPEAVALLERLGSPNVKINLDSANVIYWEGRRPEEEVAAMAPYIVHLHLKDKRGGRGEYEFPPVGSGEIDWRAILAALEAVGFAGPMMVEPELAAPKSERPAAQVEEALADPGSAYLTHTYLGTDDPAAIDADLRSSLAALEELLPS
jgi:L-ribulose-5-phosphate 3-epimerase